MFDLRYTREDQSIPALVSAGTVINDEGYALVVDKAEGNAYSVKLSTNDSTDDYIGASAFETRPPTRYPIVKEFTLPADVSAMADGTAVGTLIDPKYGAVIAGSIIMFRASTGTSIAHANAAVSKQYVYLDDGVVKGHVDAAVGGVPAAGAAYEVTGYDGEVIRVQAAYTPTLERQLAIVGSHIDATPLSAGAAVSAIRRGLIYTSAYLTRASYGVGDAVHITAGGLYAKAGGTGPLAGAFIAHVPTAEVPFLGIEFT